LQARRLPPQLPGSEILKVSASANELLPINIVLMKSIKSVAMPAALIVFVICVYAFLLGNKVFEGKFENEAIAWYILAKGIFCSVALVALSRILDGIIARLCG
jgi:hypothetical protein